jgi:biopolymer transport protein ExbD
MMAMTATAHEGSACSDINMTPLIDVMLVLLIIFIITIPPLTHAVKIDNPRNDGTPPQVTPRVVNLQIDFDGTLLWDSATVDRRTLQRYISTAAAQSPQPEVHIIADRFTRYEVVAQTLADLQYRGLQRIGFVNRAY